MPESTPEAKREAERVRAARRKTANEQLAKLPSSSRDAVTRDAQRREAAHTGARVAAVTFIEEALDAFRMKGANDAAAHVRSSMAQVRAGTVTGDPAPPADLLKVAKDSGHLEIVHVTDKPAKPRPKSPREKSTPKEAGRPKPETKQPELAATAKAERGGDAAIAVTVDVSVPDGTAYCEGCDKTLPESTFWPIRRTAKSHRRKTCRDCFNAAWKAWDEARRAKAAAS